MMGADEDAKKKAEAEKEKARLLVEMKVAREQLARDAARDAARLDSKFK